METGLLKGKAAVVTGAASGMGKATARFFAGQGANVIFADVNREAAEQAAAGLDGKRVRVFQADVSENESVEALVKEVVDAFGRVDVLVNCAGVPQAFTPIEELSPDEWDKIMSVNAKSIF